MRPEIEANLANAVAVRKLPTDRPKPQEIQANQREFTCAAGLRRSHGTSRQATDIQGESLAAAMRQDPAPTGRRAPTSGGYLNPTDFR
jgi:hypothetical protein